VRNQTLLPWRNFPTTSRILASAAISKGKRGKSFHATRKKNGLIPQTDEIPPKGLLSGFLAQFYPEVPLAKLERFTTGISGGT